MRNVLCPALVFNQSALKVASDPSFHSTWSALWQTVMCDQRWLVHMPLVQSEAQPSQIWPKTGLAWEKSKWAPINLCNVVKGFIVHFTVFIHTFLLSLIVYLTFSLSLTLPLFIVSHWSLSSWESWMLNLLVPVSLGCRALNNSPCVNEQAKQRHHRKASCITATVLQNGF